MTPESLRNLRAIAEKALKHSGGEEWTSNERIVLGSIGDECFEVASVDDYDHLPVCAGEAIARHIEAAQPSVVIALLDKIEHLEKLASRVCKTCNGTGTVWGGEDDSYPSRCGCRR